MTWDDRTDPDFRPDLEGLQRAVNLLATPPEASALALPDALPELGRGAAETLAHLAGPVLGGARDLGGRLSFAHMDPPTPWIAWATTLWTSALNQNLLHPDTAPVAREIEARVVDWLAPIFGMDGGHMVPGGTVANLTAIWAARECRGVRRVVASDAAHLSVRKAAHLLGLEYLAIPARAGGALDAADLPRDLEDAVLVLTAGTTARGAIDPLGAGATAGWRHVDAAWAGPLRLSPRFADRLNGIEAADSVTVSAHKWLFQPKESALVLFRDAATAHRSISAGGGYLAVPNVGVLGSHGAAAVPLLATLLAWGRSGVAARIERAMEAADDLYQALDGDPRIVVAGPPETGVVLWRPSDARPVDEVFAQLPNGLASRAEVNGKSWIRQVAANPMVDIDAVLECIFAALEIR